MSKLAFKMKLKPGARDEYIKRHNDIWPVLVSELKKQGISDYSIFLDEDTHTLFAVQMAEGPNSQKMADYEIVKKWWKYMADIMETNPDSSPVASPLTKVFHMD